MPEEKKRIIKFKGKELPDPGPNFDAEAIRNLYKGQFPELAAAKVEVREQDGVEVIEFVHQVGTKG